jgi:hypothetical protein
VNTSWASARDSTGSSSVGGSIITSSSTPTTTSGRRRGHGADQALARSLDCTRAVLAVGSQGSGPWSSRAWLCQCLRMLFRDDFGSR